MVIAGMVHCLHIKLSPSGSFVREVHDTCCTYCMIKECNREFIKVIFIKFGTLIPSYMRCTATGQ
jgi:hypothetical protein